MTENTCPINLSGTIIIQIHDLTTTQAKVEMSLIDPATGEFLYTFDPKWVDRGGSLVLTGPIITLPVILTAE